jgi:Holliday junction resolvase RusA-like endonuclease
MLRIVIEGEPVAQARPRLGRRGDRQFAYDPQKAEKGVVIGQFRTALADAISTRPEILIEMAQAQSFHVELTHYTNLNKKDATELGMWQIFDFTVSPSRPDLDNYIKFILDCCNGVLWKDDCMITKIVAKKQYSRHPHTEIVVIPIKNLSLPEKTKKILSYIDCETMNQITCDAQKIAQLGDPSYLLGETADRRVEWALAATSALIEFAQKHGDILRKIKKIGCMNE